MDNLTKNQSGVANAKDVETYIATRVDDQIRWYNLRSSRLKSRYRLIKFLTIIISAMIPVTIAISGMDNNSWDFLKYGAAILGAMITVLEGISGVLKDKETYLGYRSASEALVREKMKFQSGSGYSEDSADKRFIRFVENCETIMAGESNKWLSTFQQDNSGGEQK